jgi:class 3 adenylate cyclase
MQAAALAPRLDAMRSGGHFSPGVLEAFGEFVEQAPEDALYRASPVRYAKEKGVSEREAIELFLYAAHAGIFEMNWGVVCPGCGAFLTIRGGLRQVMQTRFCSLCEIDVAVSIDESVEVGFTVTPAVRRIRFHDPETLDLRTETFRVFFSSSLVRDQKVSERVRATTKALGRIPTAAAVSETVVLEPAYYTVLAPELQAVAHFDAGPEGPSTADFDFHEGQVMPARATVSAGQVTLNLRNRTPNDLAYQVFISPYPPPELRAPDYRIPRRVLLPFLTGRRLLTAQAFTDLFRAQSIPADRGLELNNLTVLFTDLKGSTAMYERSGDLGAYDLVRRHFSALREIVSLRGGAVVKTIGDAIMASFDEPRSAMDAAVSMNQDIRAVGPDLLLKIGIHAGPCIAVELNERLDYFGQTVNIAARVQGLADANEIVVTDLIYAAPGVAELAAAASLEPTRENAKLKGIGEATAVVRLR